MSVLRIHFFTVVILAIPSVLLAQDPFGPAGAPFGQKPTPTATDPFAATPAAPSPFDDTPASADPFGSHVRKQAAHAKPLAPRKAAVKKGVVPSSTRDAEDRIRRILGDVSAFNFVELPLSDAVMQFSEMHKIPIVVDKRALEGIGISGDVPVSLSLQDVSLRVGLRLLLRDLDLTYLLDNGVLQITTVQAAEENLKVRMILLGAAVHGKKDELVDAIIRSIDSDTWDEAGGPSTLSIVGNVLVVSSVEAVNEQVEAFVDEITRLLE